MQLANLSTEQLEAYRDALLSAVRSGTASPETVDNLQAYADESMRRIWNKDPIFPAWLQYDAVLGQTLERRKLCAAVESL